MRKTRKSYGWIVLFGMMAALFFAPNRSFAHCDTLDGPVVKTARVALEKGDVTPLLKWVRPADEQEIKEAFRKTVAVRGKGGEAKELADRYFFETLVRIHRAGEGAPYTGLKPGAEIDPAVAMADKALEDGNIDKLVEVLTKAVAGGIRERFHKVAESGRHADESVAAGRKFVADYVSFTHYVEGLHGMIKAGGGHHGEEAHQGAAAQHGGEAAPHGHGGAAGH